MKRIVVFAFALLLLFAFAVGVSADRGYSYKAPKGTPTIDGEADEIWENAAWIHVKTPDGGGKPNTESTLRIKLMWDEKNLYFLADVFDDEYHQNGDTPEVRPLH